MKRTIPWVLGLTLVAGCGDSTPSGGTPDTGVADTGVADTGAMDTSVADTGASDTGVADTGVSDAGVRDGGVADGNVTRDVPATDGSADAGPTPFGCLGRVTFPAPTATMATMRAELQNFQTSGAMPGLTMKACARADTTCATPHSMAVSDAGGMVTLTFPLGPMGFDGYFEVTGGTGANAVTPTRSFTFPPIRDAAPVYGFALIPQTTFTVLGGALGAMLDDTHGGVVFGVLDCNGGGAAGVAVTTAPPVAAGSTFYFAGGLPNPTSTQTDATGQGGILNVAPGPYTITGTVVSSMTRLGAVPITVRGGFLTSLNVAPSP